jgi:hypothetical protein
MVYALLKVHNAIMASCNVIERPQMTHVRREASMKISTIIGSVGMAASLMLSAPASATEVVNVDFRNWDSGYTSGLYSGILNITVTGTGFSASRNLNDAFYVFTTPYIQQLKPFQLGFTTIGNDFLLVSDYTVGGSPSYDPTHVYNFLLDTGLTTASELHFGITDAMRADNGGSFTVTINSAPAVPEAATWAMMLVGFGLTGWAIRRKKPADSPARAATAAVFH